MLIDLHCHTKAIKRGDGKKRNVDAATFVSRVSRAGVGIVAITNHNAFDLDQYNEFVCAANGAFQIWPGVELDVTSGAEGSHWHMLVVCSPINAHVLDGIIKKLLSGLSPNDCLLKFSDVKAAFQGIDSLFISHCHDKRPFVREAELKEIFNAENGPWNYFFEPRTLITVGIMASHGWNMMLGSDIKDWTKYPNCELPQLRLAVDSFEQFVLLAKRDSPTIQTILEKVSPVPMVAHPHVDVDVKLPIFKEVNVIFGQKGTGKSEIAKSLKDSVEAQGLTCSSYLGNQKSSQFDALLNVKAVPREPSSLGLEDFKDSVEKICNLEERTPIPLDGFIDWAKTEGNNEKKSRFSISRCMDLPVRSLDNYERHSKNYSDVTAFADNVGNGAYLEYLSAEDSSSLNLLLSKLQHKIIDKRNSEYVCHKSELLANKSLHILKMEIDRKSSTKSIPGSVGYFAFARERLTLMRAVCDIKESLKPKEQKSYDYLGRFDDKGVVNLVTAYRLLQPDSRTKEFINNISELREWKKYFDALSNSFESGNVAKCRSDFSDYVTQTGIESLKDFIGVRRFVELASTGIPYDPSDGEKGILLLERVLNQEADWYVLDEPEAGMSNSYIDGVIRPLVVKLGKAGKTVVIATHNANLAVRTLPYSSIYREHQNGQKYKTYIGNPFIDKLVNIDDSSDDVPWSGKSMEVLEGGEEAFFERMRIYEAGA